MAPRPAGDTREPLHGEAATAISKTNGTDRRADNLRFETGVTHPSG